MRRPTKNRRAISNVVSALLMILVVMVGMGLLFAYLTTYVANYQAGSGSSVFESMSVEDVWFKNTNQVEIWIYNVGKVGFAIDSIYLNGTAIDQSDFTVNAGGSSNTVPVGGHADLMITSAQGWITENKYSFKIVTSRGSSFIGTYSPTT